MDLKQQLKQYEGTKEYQTKVGYFKNGKYWQYKDSLGYPTIGFGHLVLKGEDFSNGIIEAKPMHCLIKILQLHVLEYFNLV